MLSSVSPSLCSEAIEENPYRPTYIFPENCDIQMKSKGIRWQWLHSCWLDNWSAVILGPFKYLSCVLTCEKLNILKMASSIRMAFT